MSAQLQEWINKQSEETLRKIAYELTDHLIAIDEVRFDPDAEEGYTNAPHWNSCGIVIGEII